MLYILTSIRAFFTINNLVGNYLNAELLSPEHIQITMDANVLTGAEENTGIPHQSFGKLLLDAFKSHEKDSTAMTDVESGESYTYEDLIEISQNLASNLREFGIERNDIVGIVSENSHKFCVALLACLYLGAPVHLINPKSTEYELQHLLSLSEPKLLFSSKKSLNNLMRVKNDLDFIEKVVVFDVDEEREGLLLYKNLIKISTRFFYVEEDIDIETQTAIICNSSGTTGLPKGVMLTHQHFRFHLVCSRGILFQMKPFESIQLCLSFFHLYSLHVINATLYSGAALIIHDHFDPHIFLKTIENHSTEQLFLVPPLINFLANSPLTERFNLSSVRHIFNAAAPILEEDSRLLTKKFNIKIIQGYGLTETGIIVTTSGNESYPVGSCGKLVPGCQLKIVDTETRQKLAANKPGEICIRGRQNMKGYIFNVKETNKIFDSEGFIHTGDIGYYDEEGFIYIVGRNKDMINYKGHKVSPVEIENILLNHPSIQEVAVVGKPDKRSGEVAMGFVVKKAGSRVSEKDICDYLSEFVCTEKRLHGGVRFIGAIPKNSNGKILRKELRKIFE